MMNVRDYILLGDKLCHKIESAAKADLMQWSQDWALDNRDIMINGIIPVAKLAEENGQPWGSLMLSDKLACLFTDQTSACHAMLQLDTEAITQLGNLLFQDKFQYSDFQRSCILHDILGELLADLVSRFTNKNKLIPEFIASLDMQEILPSEWFAQGAGTICIQLSIGSGSALLVLPWEGVKHLFPAGLHATKQTQTLSRLVDALEARFVHGNIVLGEVELTVESLKSLQPGDVLCLDVSLQNPVKLQLDSAAHGWSLCGFLGKQDCKQAFLVESVEG